MLEPHLTDGYSFNDIGELKISASPLYFIPAQSILTQPIYILLLVLVPEHHTVDFRIEDGVLVLKRYSYGCIDITPFGKEYEHDDKLYDGIEIAAMGDIRDTLDLYFDGKLITHNVVLLKLPSSIRGFQDNHTEFVQNFDKTKPYYEALVSGFERVRADRAETLKLRIRNVVLIFPSFYQLSNEIFSPTSMLGREASSCDAIYNFTNYKYNFETKTVKVGNIRASWMFNKVNEMKTKEVQTIVVL